MINGMNSKSRNNSYALLGWWIGAIFIPCVWLLLVGAKNYPPPHIDDGGYIGAAINLYRGLGFVNTFCDSLHRWPFTEGYYCYLPAHSYILAAWLKIFGLNSLSMRMFPATCAMASSFLIYRFFSPSRFSIVAAIGIVACVLVFLGGTGLRPDSLGLLFFVAGLSAFESRKPLAFFSSNLSLAMGAISYANVIYIGLLVTIGSAIYHCLSNPKERGLWLRLGIMAVMAYIVATMFFLYFIHFSVADFWTGFEYSKQKGLAVVQAQFNIKNTYEAIKWSAVQGAFLFLLGYLFLRSRKENAQTKFTPIFIAVCYFALAFTCTSSISGSHIWATGCALTGFYLIWNGSYAQSGVMLLTWFLFCGILIMAHGHYILCDLLSDHRVDLRRNQSIIYRLKASNPATIYVDSYAMRELYGYDAPPNVFDYCQSSLSGWLEPKSYEDIPADSIAVISVAYALPGHGAEQKRPLFGMLGPYICDNPYDLVVNDHRLKTH